MKKLIKLLALLSFFIFQTWNALDDMHIINENTVFDVDASWEVYLYSLYQSFMNMEEIIRQITNTNVDHWDWPSSLHWDSYWVIDLMKMKWDTELNWSWYVVTRNMSTPFNVDFLTWDGTWYRNSNNWYETGLSLPRHSNYSSDEKFITWLDRQEYASVARLWTWEVITFWGIDIKMRDDINEDFYDSAKFFYKKWLKLYNWEKVCPAKKKCTNWLLREYNDNDSGDDRYDCWEWEHLEDINWDRYWKNTVPATRETLLYKLVKEPNENVKKRHLARFRKIWWQIYMIWWWWVDPRGGRVDGLVSKINREYKNEIRTINPSSSFEFWQDSCPVLWTWSEVVSLSSTATLTGNVISAGISNSYSRLSGQEWVIDMMKIWSNMFYVVRKNWWIWLWNSAWALIKKLDDVKYFFNSQVHCPNSDTCFYSISWWIGNKDFENPHSLVGNKLNGDFKIFKIESRWTTTELTWIEYPSTLPNLTWYWTWRILHQMILSWDDEDNLNIKIYWWRIIDQDDRWGVTWSFPYFYKDYSWANLTPDTIDIAKAEYDVDWDVPSWQAGAFLFDSSVFLESDTYGYYEWDVTESDPDWHHFNFSIWETQRWDNLIIAPFSGRDIQNKIYEYRQRPTIRSRTNRISIRLNSFNWAWHDWPHHRCGIRVCDRALFIQITWSTNIDTYYTYSTNWTEINGLDENNMKINLNPIQSLANNNKLAFSWNFDFSATDGRLERHKNNKIFLWAVFMEEEVWNDDWIGFLENGFLDDMIVLRNERIGPMQYQGDREERPSQIWPHSYDSPPTYPAPGIWLDRTPYFTISEQPAIYDIIEANVTDDGEKWSFFIEKEFDPWWHRVHILLTWVANPDRKWIILQSDMWYWFNWHYNTWRWWRHDWIIQPSDFWAEASQVWFMRVFYRAFVYEFYVPEVTNFPWIDTKHYWNSPVFKWKFAPNNSQMIFYSWTWNNVPPWTWDSIFRLNDIPQNVTRYATWFSLESGWNFSALENETSNKIDNIVEIIWNTELHHKIRSSKSDDKEIVWTFDYKPVFNFAKDKTQNLHYWYIDDLWNIIFWKEFWFTMKEEEVDAEVVLNEHFTKQWADNIVIKNSIRPFISWYYIPEKEMRALLLSNDWSIIDEITVLTDSGWLFEIQPNIKLEHQNLYTLIFYDKRTDKIWSSFKIKIDVTQWTPEISLNNWDIVFSKRPIFYWNWKANQDIKIQIFTEDQSALGEEECVRELTFNKWGTYTCNKLWKVWDIKILTQTWITIDQNGRWDWLIDTDLLETDLLEEDIDSQNIYFIKVYYDLGRMEEQRYEIKSFRFLPQIEEDLSSNINSWSWDVVELNNWLLDVELKRPYYDLNNEYNKDFSTIKFLENWGWSINWNFLLKMAPFSFLEIKSWTWVFRLQKWIKIISWESWAWRYVIKGEELVELKEWDIILSQYNSPYIQSNWTYDINFSSNIEFSPYKWLLEMIVPKLNYYSKESIDKLSFFNCDEIFDFAWITEASEKNRENCLMALSTIFNNDQVKTNKDFKVTNIKNWQILLTWTWKYLIQWNAWANSKVKISVNWLSMWSATTNENWQFLFRLPAWFEGWLRTARIRLDNSDIASQSVEFFVIIRNDFLNFEDINPNNLIQNSENDEFKDPAWNINKWVRLNKIPEFY